METTINKLIIDRADTQRLTTQIVAVIIGGIAVLSFNVAPVVTGVVAEQIQLDPSLKK